MKVTDGTFNRLEVGSVVVATGDTLVDELFFVSGEDRYDGETIKQVLNRERFDVLEPLKLDALPVGTVVRDRSGDREELSGRKAECDGRYGYAYDLKGGTWLGTDQFTVISVPDENPQEPKVGDRIRAKHFGEGVVTAIRPSGYIDANEGLTFETDAGADRWTFIKNVEVIKPKEDDEMGGLAKAGDKVRMLTDDVGVGDYEKGDVFDVKESVGRVYIVDNAGDKRCINEHTHLKYEVIGKGDVDDLNVGDRKILKKGGEWPLVGFKDGDEVEITDLHHPHDTGNHIEVERVSEGEAGYTTADNLAPVPPFKVGDKVEIIGNDAILHNFDIGSVGEVVECDASDGSFYVKVPGKPRTQWVKDTELKLAKPLAMSDLKVGSKLKLIDDFGADLTEGKVYEVTRFDEWGDAQIYDDDGDEYDLCDELEHFTVVDDETPTPSDADKFFDSLTQAQRELLKRAL